MTDFLAVTIGDFDTWVRTVYGEARGESFPGMKAVAWVIKNRWTHEKGQFVKDQRITQVCTRYAQFSCWLQGDPNFRTMMEGSPADLAYRRCMAAVLEVMDEPVDYITNDSRHYHAVGSHPTWSKGHQSVAKIGRHVFYNDVP
jgi:N-acetylmuramoyl-L-alanine amidase